jgi:hypothetical protein
MRGVVDTDTVIRILCQRSYSQIKETIKEYSQIKGTELKDFGFKTSGDFRRCLVAIGEISVTSALFLLLIY